MILRTPSTTFFGRHAWLLAVLLGSALVFLRSRSAGIPEGGDDVLHYLHAHYFWQHAVPAMAQWAKPVFSLLASPFAVMMGPLGMTVFDALCAVIACVVIMRTLASAGTERWSWLAAPMLLFTPVYMRSVMCGLTEPLFGTAALSIVLLLIRRQHAWALVLTGALPFIRPEYLAFAPFALVIVALRRDFRALIALPLALMVYSALSGILIGRPFAFFSEAVYVGNARYGRGDPFFYVDNIDAAYGLPLKRCVLIAIVLVGILLWRDRAERRDHLTLLALTLLPALGIFAMHSVAWWRGGLASLGLIRVLATTVPLLVLFVVYTFAEAWRLLVPERTWSRVLLIGVLLFYTNTAFHELKHREALITEENEVQRTQDAAASFVNAERRPGERIVFWDPMIALRCAVDPWNDRQAGLISAESDLLLSVPSRAGDWIVWDAHFAAHEGALPLDTLLRSVRYEHLRTFEPATPQRTLGGLAYGIQVFRHRQEAALPR